MSRDTTRAGDARDAWIRARASQNGIVWNPKMSALPAPIDIDPKRKAFAFERSLGIPPAEACRRVGGKVENGQATKWERSPGVQKWLAYYRSLGQTDEMLAAKRERIEQRLELSAYGNLLDFATINPVTKQPTIDWEQVKASPYSVIVASFKFDKETGVLTDFDRDNAQQAVAQLRDMHGFKSQTRLAAEAKIEQAKEAAQAKDGNAIVTRFTLSIFDDNNHADA